MLKPRVGHEGLWRLSSARSRESRAQGPGFGVSVRTRVNSREEVLRGSDLTVLKSAHRRPWPEDNN